MTTVATSLSGSQARGLFHVLGVQVDAVQIPDVIASRLGAMAEVIEDGRSGLHFTPGDPGDLAAKVSWAWLHPEEMGEIGHAARLEHEAKYTAERNYRMLTQIYRRAGALAGVR